MRQIFIFIWLWCPSIMAIRKESTQMQQLRADLFAHYDKGAVPVQSEGHVLNIAVSLYLMIIQRLDTREQVLSSSGWIRFQWVDELLRWDPKQYHGIVDLILSQTEVWLPNVFVDNPVDEYKPFGHDQTLVHIRYDGTINWEPDFVQHTSCPVDITKYPFDDQICEMHIREWLHTNETVKLIPLVNEIYLEFLMANGEWDVTNTEVLSYSLPALLYKHRNMDSITGISFVVYLHRKRFFYVLNTIVPMVLLSCLNVLVFVLPSDCGERMSLAVSALLAITVYLGIINQNIPKISEKISYLSVYLTLLLFLSTASVICAGIVINIHFRSADIPVPEAVVKVLKSCCYENLDYNDELESVIAAQLQLEQARHRHSASPVGVVVIGMRREMFSARYRNDSEKSVQQKGESPAVGDGDTDEEEGHDEFISVFQSEVGKMFKELHSKKKAEYATWAHVSEALDRCLFWLFFILTISVNLILLSLLIKD